MGQITPNIGIYIPAAGETNYDAAFAAGMVNIDQHDHSGGPNKGVPITAAGLGPGSVTRVSLNANILSPGGGLGFDINNAIFNDGVVKVIRQVFVASGTYTPSAKMKYCDIEVLGGGGGGSGALATAGTGVAGGGGGGAGYSRKVFPAVTIGASQAVTVGAAGAAGTAGNNPGGTGGTSSVGALISATGGVGGAIGSINSVALGGVGGAGAGGDFNTVGHPGGKAIASGVTNSISGEGGSTFFGGGGNAIIGVGAVPGNSATSYGGGGGGAACFTSATPAAGGAGFAGIVIVTEYTS